MPSLFLVIVSDVINLTSPMTDISLFTKFGSHALKPLIRKIPSEFNKIAPALSFLVIPVIFLVLLLTVLLSIIELQFKKEKSSRK